MHTPRPRPGPPRWLHLPRRTARLRLTVLYGGAVFLACGATVLAFTYLLYGLLDGHPTHPALLLQKQGQLVPIANAQPAEAAIHVAGLGQIAMDKQQLLIASAIALAVIAVAAAIGWLIAGWVLRPLSTITAAARRISASSLHERLALHGPDDELKELADTLDNLFARLEASFDAQRRFAANASHELRTLFQPFQRFGPRPARRDGGHGLGLSIVRAIATAHAATITAQPRPGGGLAIDATFPRQPVPAPLLASSPGPAETVQLRRTS